MLKPIIVPIICMLLLASSFGCIERTIDEEPHGYADVGVLISDPEISSMEVSGSTVWVASYEVRKVIADNDFVVRIKDMIIRVHQSWDPDNPIDIPLEEGEPHQLTGLQAWAVSASGKGKQLSDGDSIYLAGLNGSHVRSEIGGHLDLQYEGCRFAIMAGNWRIMDLYLPFIFVEMSTPRIIANNTDDPLSWDLEIEIEQIAPESRWVPWNEFHIRVYDRDDHRVVFDTEPEDSPPNIPVVPYYSDILDDDTPGVGDTLYIRGMGSTYQGCQLTFSWGGHWLGSSWGIFRMDLPTNFKDVG